MLLQLKQFQGDNDMITYETIVNAAPMLAAIAITIAAIAATVAAVFALRVILLLSRAATLASAASRRASATALALTLSGASKRS